MSQQLQVDPAALLAQAQALRERLTALQTTITQLEQARINVRRAIETAKSLASDEILAPTDPDYNGMIMVKPINKEKILVKLGGNIYAKVPVEKAVEILEKRADSLEKQVQFLMKEYDETLRALESIESLLQQLAVIAQQPQQPQQPKQS
ncbi:MAG: prefoldin subunit 3 [Desulfurococcales archaeon]|nr:prefoldin subunit 3 [Desulfurococcales archaeon]MEB3788459.1 prefoldin subunit 3 [Desulfurococcales archaeon]